MSNSMDGRSVTSKLAAILHTFSTGSDHSLSDIAALEAEAGDARTGARLFARAKEVASRLGAAREREAEAQERETLARLEAALGPAQLEAELAAGAAMSLEDAIELALGRGG